MDGRLRTRYAASHHNSVMIAGCRIAATIPIVTVRTDMMSTKNLDKDLHRSTRLLGVYMRAYAGRILPAPLREKDSASREVAILAHSP